MADIVPQDEKTNPTRPQGFFYPLALAWELGYTIAIPLVVLALGGRMLDRYFETSPAFFLAGIIASLFITSFLVYRKTKNFLSR